MTLRGARLLEGLLKEKGGGHAASITTTSQSKRDANV